MIEKTNRWIRTGSSILIGIGVLLLVVDLALGGTLNLALPLVFLMFGTIFFILVPIFSQQWKWAAGLFIPGAFLAALGLIFLLNVLTGDWNAWAYAWLLLVSGAGIGLALMAWYAGLRQDWIFIGSGMALLGLVFFAVFGMIAGGLAIRVAAPLLLALGGLALRWVRPENIIPARLLRRPAAPPAQALTPAPTAPAAAALAEPAAPLLVEPLSSRELEVLRLIDQGLSNQEIAGRLVVAPSTVKTHINNLYGKLGVQTRVQAIRQARELGLLE